MNKDIKELMKKNEARAKHILAKLVTPKPKKDE